MLRLSFSQKSEWNDLIELHAQSFQMRSMCRYISNCFRYALTDHNGLNGLRLSSINVKLFNFYYLFRDVFSISEYIE
jgi:hypothetical protein